LKINLVFELELKFLVVDGKVFRKMIEQAGKTAVTI